MDVLTNQMALQPVQICADPCNDLKDIKKLLSDIKATRKNRINASERLLTQERYVQAVNIYYSCFASVVSIIGLACGRKSYGVISALLTVLLAISIVYLNAQKFGDRAQQLKTNYIALHQLQFDIDNAIIGRDASCIGDYQHRYTELLKTSENHKPYDYKKTIYGWRNKPGDENHAWDRLSLFERIGYHLHAVGRFIVYIITIALPIIGLLTMPYWDSMMFSLGIS